MSKITDPDHSAAHRGRPPALLAVPGLAMLGVVLAKVLISAASGIGVRTSVVLMAILMLGVVLLLLATFHDTCSGWVRASA
jgi:hypothetical protein